MCTPIKPVVAGIVGSLLFVLADGGPCQGDIDGDGFVGIPDLLAVLEFWGTGSGSSDVSGPDGHPDGTVDGYDLIAVLDGWGECP